MSWRSFIDKAIYPVGLASPVLTYIQAAQIWFSHSAAGVSALSWIGYTIISFFWLNYGAHRKLWPLILAESFGIVGCALIVLGVLRYG